MANETREMQQKNIDELLVKWSKRVYGMRAQVGTLDSTLAKCGQAMALQQELEKGREALLALAKEIDRLTALGSVLKNCFITSDDKASFMDAAIKSHISAQYALDEIDKSRKPGEWVKSMDTHCRHMALNEFTRVLDSLVHFETNGDWELGESYASADFHNKALGAMEKR